jgi:DNA-binding CsgD family transcriptional regulator
MSTRGKLSEAIGAVYDAAGHEQHWPHALALMADLLGATTAVIYEAQAGFVIARGWYIGGGGLGLEGYTPELVAGDLKHNTVPDRVGGVVIEGTDVDLPASFGLSAAYNEFYKPADMLWTCGACVGMTPRGKWVNAFHRPHGTTTYGAGEVRAYRNFVRHAVRALRLHLTIEAEAGRQVALMDVFDRLATPMLIVGDAGKIIEANQAARRLLEAARGISSAQGRLTATTAHERARLAALLERTGRIDAETGVPDPGGSIALDRAGGLRPLLIHAVPLGIGSSANVHAEARTLVMISDPEARPVPPERMLADAFGLTPAEARMARHIAAGLGVSELSETAKVTRETARTYLKRIMDKAGVSRQSELARDLASLSAMFGEIDSGG